MILLAFLIGIYSYVILLLGIFSLLSPVPVLIATAPFAGLLVFAIFSNSEMFGFVNKLDRVEKAIICLIFAAAGVNLIGALGPELAFDALWYHATFAKIYALEHVIRFIPGGLFHYSLMPRLTEMLYASAFTLDLYNFSKLIHFTFGILTSLMLYRVARLYLSKKYSLLSVLIFYTNLVVMWLSITAYSDLSRAFFEVGALYFFLRYWKESSKKMLFFSSVFLGFAICTKLISIGTLIILIALIALKKRLIRRKISEVLLFTAVSVGIALPWFILSFYYTANPFYPLFSDLHLPHSPLVLLSPLVMVKTFISIFLFSPDPISPFYLSLIPPLIFNVKKIAKKHRVLLILSLLLYSMWYFTSQSGGARFLSSYLPLFTVLGILIVREFKKRILYIFIAITLSVACFNIAYRAVANAKYVPVILGTESRQDFLMHHLNFDFGDFYDENGEISEIVGNDKVLLINMHNLFYVDFPFTLQEWSSRDYKYILTQKSQLPEQYKNALLIYKNDKTHVKLYKL